MSGHTDTQQATVSLRVSPLTISFLVSGECSHWQTLYTPTVSLLHTHHLTSTHPPSHFYTTTVSLLLSVHTDWFTSGLPPIKTGDPMLKPRVSIHSRQSPGEIKSRELELGSHSWMDCLVAELFLNSCFSDTVFVTLARTAVKTAISDVHK